MDAISTRDAVIKKYDNGKGLLNRANDQQIADREVRHAGGYRQFAADVDKLVDQDRSAVVDMLKGKARAMFHETVQTSRLTALGLSEDQAQSVVTRGAKSHADAAALLRRLGESLRAGSIPAREFEALAPLFARLASQWGASANGAGPTGRDRDVPTVTSEPLGAGRVDIYRDASFATQAMWRESTGLPIDRIAANLKSAGFKSVSTVTVSVDYEHEFAMSYAPGGGFRGSSSRNVPGRTEMARVEVLQADPESKGGFVHATFSRPGHVGPQFSGFAAAETSGSSGLYFVPDLSLVKGCEGDVHGSDAAVKERIETLFGSIEKNSPVSILNYTEGWGRVGTSYHSSVAFADTRVHAYHYDGPTTVNDRSAKVAPRFLADVALALVATELPRAVPPSSP